MPRKPHSYAVLHGNTTPIPLTRTQRRAVHKANAILDSVVYPGPPQPAKRPRKPGRPLGYSPGRGPATRSIRIYLDDAQRIITSAHNRGITPAQQLRDLLAGPMAHQPDSGAC